MRVTAPARHIKATAERTLLSARPGMEVGAAVAGLLPASAHTEDPIR